MIKQVFEQVYDHILIDVQQRSPGEYLPSEMQYTAILDVSRLTVRKAVDVLVNEGMVTRVPGKGLIVARRYSEAKRGRLLISCVCIPGDSDLFRCALGCIDAATRLKYDYSLLNYPTAREQYEVVKKEDLSKYVGAAITCFDTPYEKLTLSLLKAAGIPVVVLGNDIDGALSVAGDDFNGGYLIGDDLVKHGHKDILYLDTDRKTTDVVARLNGFKQALSDNGVPIKDDMFIDVHDPGTPCFLGLGSYRLMPESAKRFLDLKTKFTAVTGCNTLLIVSFCHELLKRGVKIPQDISVSGYGDQLFFPELNIPISGVYEQKYDIGFSGVNTLHDYLTHNKNTITNHLVPVRYLSQKTVSRI